MFVDVLEPGGPNDPRNFTKGKIVEHPEHGRVIIVDGQYWGDVRGISNFWYWQKVDESNQPYGEVFHGYWLEIKR